MADPHDVSERASGLAERVLKSVRTGLVLAGCRAGTGWRAPPCPAGRGSRVLMTFASAAIARHSEIVQGKAGQGMRDFQSRFRLDVESTASTALRLIGADLRPRASLIGFGANSTTSPPIWIEPETEPIAVADVSGVAGRLRVGCEAHDESGWPGTDAIGRANHRAWPEDQAQAMALCEALESSVNGRGLKFFAGPPARLAHITCTS